MSYVDCVFVTQSRNLRTNIARILYLTPPVMTLPMAYITTREVLGSMYGEEGVWTYAAAAVVPGCIWGAFSKYNITIHYGSFRLFLAVLGLKVSKTSYVLRCSCSAPWLHLGCF